MCGITGLISINFRKNDLVKMTDSLTHRGPNASGYFFDQDKGVALGHRRLSIIDLSSKANQPMTSHCGRYIMVYNGEIYNFKDLANKLKKTNWKTSSDSEVILEAFVAWGIDFAYQLNGMFAIAIYDKKEDKLFLLRDRIGIKPLYYFYDERDFIFSSELKAILAIKKNLEINKESIYAYLHLGYIPSNYCIYENTYKVKPGSYITFKDNKIHEEFFWKPEKYISSSVHTGFIQTKKKLKSLLQKSVERRLVSDVPLGTFLSGGTDSSLVTAVAQELNCKKINTFSIGFKESKFNESNYARAVAKFLNTNHHEFILTEIDAINELENIMDHFDEPFCDSSALPTMLVSKMSRKYVTVCLTGDGGDELFMGYGAYSWANRINHPIYGTFRNSIGRILNFSSDNRIKRGAMIFRSPKVNWKSHIFSQEQYLFSESEIKNLLIPKIKTNIINELNQQNDFKRKLRADEKQSIFDLNNYLINDLLVKVDRTSMYCSLESRVPLLDHNIIEFALNIDRNLKTRNGVQKYILKDLLYEYIPKKIMERPKWGFSIPLEKWLKNELYFLVEKYLNKKSIEETNLLRYEMVSLLVKKYMNGESYLYNRIWNLIILQKYIIKHS